MSEEDCEDTPTTLCDLDVTNNVWVEGIVDPARSLRGICMLDTMSEKQVIYVLQRDPKAREDLPKVTSNEALLNLLNRTKLLPTGTAGDLLTRSNVRNGLPYYSQFAGRPPAAKQDK